ncbi:hypothetical protein Pla175_26810 [Pirellulimonas nuda]|uniref:Caspase domain protein n=1 Tax=Pirellulimonas nuda TaxID=2528009 RepID=A0A518DCS9_9BACT|nr:hypothetical protein [Pirellulimonas nuda]QDU89292.1 hypothetical protein Pla175_26810 [Pirellulimonas nuda]
MGSTARRIVLASISAFLHAQAYGDGAVLPKQEILVVIGAAGQPEYGRMFGQWADAWRSAADAAQANLQVIGEAADGAADREQIAAALRRQADARPDLFWLVLIGHGTYAGDSAKFNLRGADVTAEQLAGWLAPIGSPTVVVNCASASGPFLHELSADGRIVITATKSGYELNFARFGQYFSGALTDPQADLDKDDQVSLLEAYLTACRRLEEFYAEDARLATEHALLDDNGDGLGTPAAWFRGLRATQRAKEGGQLDGVRAHQVHLVASDREARMPLELRKRRDGLELELEALREQKPSLKEEDYYRQLDALMLELARVYQSANSAENAHSENAQPENAQPENNQPENNQPENNQIDASARSGD